MQKNLYGMLKMMVALALTAVLMLCGASAEAAAFSDDPDAMEAAANSVLMLKVYSADGKLLSTGSGFVMFDSMTLVTNHHVIDDGSIVVGDDDDGRQYMLDKIIIQDAGKDIAILHFVKPTEMEPLPYDTGTVKRGSKVVAIGSPIGLKNTVSMGNVSSVYQDDGVAYIQFTAPVSHGSSGGAVFNDAGQVIGVSSAMYTDGQNLNLAVSIAEVVDLYQQWDGVSAMEIAPQKKAEAAAEEEEDYISDWIDFAPTIIQALYGSTQEAMDTYTSRTVAAACAVLDYALAEASALEIGGGDTYYVATEEDVLIFCCPLMENDHGMHSMVLLYSFGEGTYSILSTDMEAGDTASLLTDDTYQFLTISNSDLADALEVLVDTLLEE